MISSSFLVISWERCSSHTLSTPALDTKKQEGGQSREKKKGKGMKKGKRRGKEEKGKREKEGKTGLVLVNEDK